MVIPENVVAITVGDYCDTHDVECTEGFTCLNKIMILQKYVGEINVHLKGSSKPKRIS